METAAQSPQPSGDLQDARPAEPATVQPATGEPAGAVSADRPPVREGRPPKDMVISMLVLLIPIALLLGFYRVVLDGDKPFGVDTAPAVEQARAAGEFAVSEPDGLDQAWQPISALFRREDGIAILRIGYVTPAGEGVQLVQSNTPAERLLPAELTAQAQLQGTLDLAGRTWQRYTARPDERALVLLEPDRTVIVVGSAAESELRDLAGALH